MRLNQYLAKSGVAARRKAEKLIKGRKVTVNNEVVTDPYRQIENTASVAVNDKRIRPSENIYILVNKPKGVTTTCSDKFAKTTILDLIPKRIIPGKKRIYPAGRLDKESTGLVILTNDGDFCQRVTHPKFGVEKEYLIELGKDLKKKDLEKAKKGVTDSQETLRVKTIRKEKNEIKSRTAVKLRVTITEGKKRHLRRLFKQLGYPVKSLERVRIGKLKLKEIKPGKFKIISAINV